jgi:penicillin-binding protein 1A
LTNSEESFTVARWKDVLFKNRSWCRKLIRAIWIFIAVSVIALPVYIYLVVTNPFNLFGGMPPLNQIENPENDLSSELISADGASLGRYFTSNRSQLRYDQLPPALVKTLIISEDHRFMEHSGMDFWSYIRVALGLVTFNPQGGGSTITQQTAKNLFKTRGDELQGKLASLGTPVELVISKTKEWIIAVTLERNFTKEEIVTLYLNTVPFNNNAYGIKIAAETYFSKPVSALNIQEIAVLVGLLQNNRDFDPANFPEDSKRKRNQVLAKLLEHKYIASQREYDSIAALPLKLNFRVQNQNQGLATYFRTVLKPELNKWCQEHGFDLYESGLKVYTTVDSRMQFLAEAAMARHMRKLQQDFDEEWSDNEPWDHLHQGENFLIGKLSRSQYYKSLVSKYGEGAPEIKSALNKKRRMRVFSWRGDVDTTFSTMDSLRYYNRFLHTGMMSMNPLTGEVKAWVGGINHRYFKFDHVLQSKRQPGSTFKPFVYGKAMEDGYSPCAEFSDFSPQINVNGETYHVANAGGSYGDGTTYTLRQAMARSLNSVTMQLMEKLEPQNVADFAQRIGINSQLQPVYSLGLGTNEVSLFELVGAYSSFVNNGIHTQPYYITHIEDKYGNVIETFIPNSRQVISKETAHKMIYMLKGGVEEAGGTSGALSDNVLIENEVGGKTGTTNNAADGWYIGLTHNLVTGVWVGGDEPSIQFKDWKSGSGGRTALPMWSNYMESIYAHPETGYKKGFFSEPDSTIPDFDCDSGLFP